MPGISVIIKFLINLYESLFQILAIDQSNLTVCIIHILCVQFIATAGMD